MFIGRPLDILAFVITLLMMVLMATGVKKSLVFNNILNAVNLSAWIFLMAAGLFYVDTSNWSQHKGFLPFGWSGVRYYIITDIFVACQYPSIGHMFFSRC